MMVKFTHYLVTRFNVPVKNWEKDKSGQTTLDDLWMKHRISLFKKYCIPTIAGQEEKKFHWIIYCGKHTNASGIQSIKESVATIPEAIIRTATDHTEMLDDLKQILSIAPTPYVITSRLDNDDGLGSGYIKGIQEHFRPADKLLLNAEEGIQYDMDEKVMTQMKFSRRNHYTSLIEEKKSPDEMLTVLGFPHDDPPAGLKIENIQGEPYWLKIIHERNVKSQLKGKPVLHLNPNYFKNIDKKDLPVSFINTLKYILKRSWQKINK